MWWKMFGYCCGDQKAHCVLWLAWRRNNRTSHLNTIHTAQCVQQRFGCDITMKYIEWGFESATARKSEHQSTLTFPQGQTPSSSTQSNPFIHWINLVRHHFSGRGGGAERVGVGGQWPWANHGLQLSRCAWPTEQISILSWRKGEQGSPRDCWRLCMCVRALFKTFFSLIGHFFAAEHTLIELMGIYFCVSVVVCLQHLLALYVPCRVSQQYRCRGAAFWWMGPHLFAS